MADTPSEEPNTKIKKDPKSAKQRMREYRERLKQNKEVYEAAKKKDREQKKEKYKPVADCSKRTQRGIPDGIGAAVKRQADLRVKHGNTIMSSRNLIDELSNSKSNVMLYEVKPESFYDIKETLKPVKGTNSLQQLVCLEEVTVRADGNCLPACGSVYAFGEDINPELVRLHIIQELVTYQEYYLDEKNLVKGYSHPNSHTRQDQFLELLCTYEAPVAHSFRALILRAVGPKFGSQLVASSSQSGRSISLFRTKKDLFWADKAQSSVQFV
ncbi:hypothetical protein EGW08_006667 [Elysia chlorotica]|uniref:Uncharacterized protein n=1 Tax=Elysia chlorotica TaxID=188477 RepID=A0A433TVI9_ELYCH|nr:hypothetical protein EGW08_006667 [Elysia chlorotica]